jgi:protein-L-isoaspartate O-methyltransferase
MQAHLRVDDGMRVIDVGTGCGHSAALLAFRLGDATGPLPGEGYDRLIATVSVRPLPASWLAALRPGGG